MPRGDRTGPMGLGPRTGRGMGSCPGGMGFGCGGGYGRGFGWRNFFTREEESEMLKDEKQALEEEVKAIKERLDEIAGQK